MRVTYSGRNLPASSREKPKVSWVRSLVPNEKNSASRATWPAVTAARGTSIMVPTRYSILTPWSVMTSSATRRTTAAWWRNSSTCPTSGIMISGITLMPRFVTSQAASKMARACISVISG